MAPWLPAWRRLCAGCSHPMKMHVVSHVRSHTLVQFEPNRLCLFVYLGGLGAIYGMISTYNEGKMSLRCGTTVNTHWWSADVPNSPFGLVWDVLVSPARIYGRPTSSAGFPLVPLDNRTLGQ